jgi:hypothetical protein
LSVCGALIEDQVTGYGESSRSKKGLDKLSSSRHHFFSVWHLRQKGPFFDIVRQNIGPAELKDVKLGLRLVRKRLTGVIQVA